MSVLAKLKLNQKSAKNKAITKDSDIEREQELESFRLATNSKTKRRVRKKKEEDDLEAEETEYSNQPAYDPYADKEEITKKEKSTALSSNINSKTKKKAPAVTTSKLKTKAAKQREKLGVDIKDIEEEIVDFEDNTWLTTYKSMFNKLQGIMRVTEERTAKSEKAADIYALMALYNQMREVIADMRSMIDLTQNTQRIIDKVLYPLIRDISNNYVDSIYRQRKNLSAQVDGEIYAKLQEELAKIMGEHGKFIQESYEKSCQRLTAMLED